MEEQAQKDDVLVPIRLEIDVDGLVLRDTFTWNLYGMYPLCQDFAEVNREDKAIRMPRHTIADPL